jgi:membrane fusion protein, peptide pheromone/bacteriocin exporter
MRAIVHDWNSMTDSRELFEAKTHPVIPIFIGLVLLMLASAICWAYFSEKDIVVNAQGVVRPNENVGIIKNKILGTVQGIHYTAGKFVKKGELLYVLDAKEVTVQRNALQSNLKKLESNQRILLDFQNLVRQRDEVIMEEKPSHASSFGKYSAAQKLELEWFETQRGIREASDTSENLKLLESSILNDTNYIKDANSNYFNRYVDYELKLKQLTALKDKAIQKFKNDIVSNEFDTAKQQVDEAQLQLNIFTNETLLGIRTTLEEKKKQLAKLEIDKARISTELQSLIESTEQSMQDVKDKLSALNISGTDYEMRSPINGVVNPIIELTEGELVQPGSEVMSIVPVNNSVYTVQLSLSNQNVADVKVGDVVKFQFAALPYKEFGELTGTVRSISVDAVINKENGGSYYLVEASLQNKPLYSYKGEEAHIKVGMLTQAHIISGSKRILYELLEKINLLG